MRTVGLLCPLCILRVFIQAHGSPRRNKTDNRFRRTHKQIARLDVKPTNAALPWTFYSEWCGGCWSTVIHNAYRGFYKILMAHLEWIPFSA